MKKIMLKSLVLVVAILLSVLFIAPVMLHADPSNLVENGDFSSGNLDGWIIVPEGAVVIYEDGGNNVAKATRSSGVETSMGYVLSSVPTTNLSFSCKIKPISFSDGTIVVVGAYLYSGAVPVGTCVQSYAKGELPIDSWTTFTCNLSSYPAFDNVVLQAFINDGTGDDVFYFDDFNLSEIPVTPAEVIPAEVVWVRTHPMTCWQIYVNEEGNFEFIFWWEYANNNWVKIYDMEDNLVYELDFPYGAPRFEVDLPGGMYKVKTFHEEGNILQEFVIGKP